ncbi:MAG: mechanosensitive ion channel family protein [Terriglobales bacterium]
MYLGLLKQYPWAVYVAQIAAVILAGWITRRVLIGHLKRFAKRTETTYDDALVAIIDAAIKPLIVLAVLAVSLNLFALPPKLLKVSNRMLVLGALSVTLYYGSKVVQLLLNAWLERRAGSESVREPVSFLVRVVFAGLATMVVLDNLGISLTAVWTTLGVGSVAVALALQDTLSNFFAGVYVRLDRPVRMGDYIKLEGGEEGFVVQLGWRSTRIRTLPNNIVVVPNGKLATAIVTNYSLPETQMSLLISIGVSYDNDPEKVERILVEEATRAGGQIEGLLSDPPPFVRFIPGFGDSSLNFTLICRVNTFVDQYLVQHELRKCIFTRFRQEGIVIPFPQRDVHLYSHVGTDSQATELGALALKRAATSTPGE